MSYERPVDPSACRQDINLLDVFARKVSDSILGDKRSKNVTAFCAIVDEAKNLELVSDHESAHASRDGTLPGERIWFLGKVTERIQGRRSYIMRGLT